MEGRDYILSGHSVPVFDHSHLFRVLLYSEGILFFNLCLLSFWSVGRKHREEYVLFFIPFCFIHVDKICEPSLLRLPQPPVTVPESSSWPFAGFALILVSQCWAQHSSSLRREVLPLLSCWHCPASCSPGRCERTRLACGHCIVPWSPEVLVGRPALQLVSTQRVLVPGALPPQLQGLPFTCGEVHEILLCQFFQVPQTIQRSDHSIQRNFQFFFLMQLRY